MRCEAGIEINVSRLVADMLIVDRIESRESILMHERRVDRKVETVGIIFLDQVKHKITYLI